MYFESASSLLVQIIINYGRTASKPCIRWVDQKTIASSQFEVNETYSE